MKFLKNEGIAITTLIVVILLSSLYGLSKKPEPISLESDIPPTDSLDISPPHESVLDENFELGQAYYCAGEYDFAINTLKNVSEVSPCYLEAQELLSIATNHYRAEILDDADGFVTNGDLEDAIKTLRKAADTIGQDADLTAKLNILESNYKDTVISRAQEIFVEYDAKCLFSAEGMIDHALKVIPDDKELQQELTYYKEREPIEVISSNIVRLDSGLSTKPSASDAFGNKYKNVICINVWGNERAGQDDSSTWWYSKVGFIDTDYQYRKITGVLFQSADYASAPTLTKFSLGSLWEGQVTGNSEPVSFCVDISDKKEVMFSLSGKYENTDTDRSYDYAYVAELYLWK